jgi:hypothetical protein
MRGLKLAVVSFVLAACTMLLTPSVAQAHDGRRHERDGRTDVRVFVARDGGYFYGAGPARRPHGWERGRKLGWGGCDLPPGQAKKYGCYGSAYRPYYAPRYYYVPPRRSSVTIFFSLR